MLGQPVLFWSKHSNLKKGLQAASSLGIVGTLMKIPIHAADTCHPLKLLHFFSRQHWRPEPGAKGFEPSAHLGPAKSPSPSFWQPWLKGGTGSGSGKPSLGGSRWCPALRVLVTADLPLQILRLRLPPSFFSTFGIDAILHFMAHDQRCLLNLGHSV